MREIIEVILFFFIGGIWASFGLIIPIIIIRTGFPLIKELSQYSLINGEKARKRSVGSIVIWVATDLLVIFLLLRFATRMIIVGFLMGGVFALILGIKKTGPNVHNKKDFMHSYSSCISSDHIGKAAAIVFYFPQKPTQEQISKMENDFRL